MPVGVNAMGVEDSPQSSGVTSVLAGGVSQNGGPDPDSTGPKATQGIVVEISALLKEFINDVVNQFLDILKEMGDMGVKLAGTLDELLEKARDMEIPVPEFIAEIPDFLRGKIMELQNAAAGVIDDTAGGAMAKIDDTAGDTPDEGDDGEGDEVGSLAGDEDSAGSVLLMSENDVKSEFPDFKGEQPSIPKVL